MPTLNTLLLSPSTATRLARLARLRAWLDTNGNLRLSRSLEKIASGGTYSASHEERLALVSFFDSEAPCRLYRDLRFTLYPLTTAK